MVIKRERIEMLQLLNVYMRVNESELIDQLEIWKYVGSGQCIYNFLHAELVRAFDEALR